MITGSYPTYYKQFGNSTIGVKTLSDITFGPSLGASSRSELEFAVREFSPLRGSRPLGFTLRVLKVLLPN